MNDTTDPSGIMPPAWRDDDGGVAVFHTMTAGDISPAVMVQLRVALGADMPQVRITALQCWHRCACGRDAVVADAMYDSDAEVRATAFHVVLGWQCADWLDVCQRGLHDACATVRLAVLRAVAQYELVIPAALLYDCLGDHDSQVACKAAELLATRDDATGIQWLLDCLHQRDMVRKRRAIRALGYAQVDAAVPLLTREIQHQSPCLLSSIDALGYIAAPASLPLLLVLIADVSYAVRAAAVNALVRVQCPDSIIPVMRQALQHDTRRHVRIAAIDVLLGYQVSPSTAEFMHFAAHVSTIPHPWMVALATGSAAEIYARLVYLYAQGVDTHVQGFTKRLYKCLARHSDAATILGMCVHADSPGMALLGVLGYATHGMMISQDMLVMLVTHPDMAIRNTMAQRIETCVHDDAGWRMVWYVSDPQFQLTLVPRLLVRGGALRALVWQTVDAEVRQRAIAFLTKDIRMYGTLVAQLTADEIAQIACWAHDTRLIYPTRIHDIVTAWRTLQSDSACAKILYCTQHGSIE